MLLAKEFYRNKWKNILMISLHFPYIIEFFIAEVINISFFHLMKRIVSAPLVYFVAIFGSPAKLLALMSKIWGIENIFNHKNLKLKGFAGKLLTPFNRKNYLELIVNSFEHPIINLWIISFHFRQRNMQLDFKSDFQKFDD